MQSRPSLFLTYVFSCGAILSIVSCGARPEGYWTSPYRSQALTNQEYSADSQRCQALVANDRLEKSHSYKTNLFTHCMEAKGYQWVAEPRRPQSLNASARLAPLSIEDCSTGRLTIDAFGYQKCVPNGTKDGGTFQEPSGRTTTRTPSSTGAIAATLEQASPASDDRRKDDEVCRQYAKVSMSSTYAVYSQCMTDKGWPLKH